MRRTPPAALAAALLLLAACTDAGDPAAAPTTPPAAATSSAAPAPSVSVGLPPGSAYAEPCRRVAELAGEWADLAVRVAETANLADDVTRAEVESLISRLTEVTPLLPAEVQPLMPDLVDPLVVLRAVLMTGDSRDVVFGPGRDAVPQIFERCVAYVPNYDDGGAGPG